MTSYKIRIFIFLSLMKVLLLNARIEKLEIENETDYPIDINIEYHNVSGYAFKGDIKKDNFELSPKNSKDITYLIKQDTTLKKFEVKYVPSKTTKYISEKVFNPLDLKRAIFNDLKEYLDKFDNYNTKILVETSNKWTSFGGYGLSYKFKAEELKPVYKSATRKTEEEVILPEYPKENTKTKRDSAKRDSGDFSTPTVPDWD